MPVYISRSLGPQSSFRYYQYLHSVEDKANEPTKFMVFAATQYTERLLPRNSRTGEMVSIPVYAGKYLKELRAAMRCGGLVYNLHLQPFEP